MVPLALAEPGVMVEVVDFRCGRSCAFRLQEMGIVKGARYRVTSCSGRGPLILANGDTRIGLGAGMAAKVMVREVGDE
jgi:ferrous iron transport protein A